MLPPSLPTSFLSLFALCTACAPDAASLLQPVDSPALVTASAADRIVDPMTVEVLPVQPPGRHPLLGSFRMERYVVFDWEDISFLDEMKQKAASLGGNTLVCTEDDPSRVKIYYIPEDCGSHGGDDE